MTIGSTFRCPECGEIAVKLYANSQYCSPKCRWDAYYHRGREKRAQDRGVATCPVCLEDFPLRTTKHIYCSVPCLRRANLASREYGVTPNILSELLETQGYVCGICETPIGTWFDGNIDHNHKTGKVRGILCMHCNFLLGHAKDNPDTLQKAIGYLYQDWKDSSQNE